MSEPAAAPQPFHGGMTVDEAMKHHPVARWVFFSYNIIGCNSCASSEAETLEQLSAKYGIPLELLLSDLNDLLN